MNKALAICLCFCASPLFAQDPVIKVGTEEVVLDVVARDKKGQPVTNLEAGDIEVYDNGVKRKITSFRLVEGAEVLSEAAAKAKEATPGAPPAEARKKLNPLQQIRLVTLIFNQLDIDARHLAHNAALDLLKNDLPQNVYMSVLVLGQSLQAIQPFTNDRDLLRKGVERATSGAYTEFGSDSGRIEAQLQQIVGPDKTGAGSAGQVDSVALGGGGTGAANAPDGGAAANQAMATMMLNMLQSSQRSELAQTGRAAIFGLMSAVEQQFRLPGRKSILFFSSGFGVPQGLEEVFRTLISTANRYNVTFYSIDARGLNTTSPNKAAVAQLKDASSAAMANSRRGSGTVTPAMANGIDTAINSGKADGQNTLAELAESTGGFLIANTNDFREPLRKVSQDIETYYEITYNPGIENYDGAFRKVEVKTDRPQLHLQSRSGYYALPATVGASGAVLSPYELPLLQALEAKPAPREFGFQSSGMHFRDASNGPTCELVIDVPIGNLTLDQDKTAGRYTGDFAYLALVKDAQGRVVRKFRNTVPLASTMEQFAQLRDSHFIYTEHFDLPPGRYTLETAVLDRAGKKSSVRKSTFFMPPQDARLGISSIAMVRNIRDKGQTTSNEDPFLMAGKLVTPTLTSLVKKSLASDLSFYVVVYPDLQSDQKPSMYLEFQKDGQILGSSQVALGDKDAMGRIQYVATAPTAKLEPGNYQIRFVAKQGTEATQEFVTFSLE